MVLNVHRNHKAYYGRGGGGGVPNSLDKLLTELILQASLRIELNCPNRCQYYNAILDRLDELLTELII